MRSWARASSRAWRRSRPRYKARIVAADETESVLTEAFEIGWPGRPHRVLRNESVARWPHGLGDARDVVAHRHRDGTVVDIPRYFVDCPTPDVDGAIEEMAPYAGPSAVLVREIEPAGSIVRRIADDAAAVLRGLAPQQVAT